jgi:hypothetical protein
MWMIINLKVKIIKSNIKYKDNSLYLYQITKIKMKMKIICNLNKIKK